MISNSMRAAAQPGGTIMHTILMRPTRLRETRVRRPRWRPGFEDLEGRALLSCQAITKDLAALLAEKAALSRELSEATPPSKPAIASQIKRLLPLIATDQKALRYCELDGKNAATQRVGKVLLDGTDGDVGLYLKQVNGPVLAAFHETMDFEPASAIKALIGLHAMRQIEASKGKLTLDTQVHWDKDYVPDQAGKPTSCPADSGLATETLRDALRGMLQDSDNRQTQALRVYFGQANINATAQSIGMTHTSYNHRDGCGGGPDGAVTHPNHLTLVDAGTLYEGIASGTLLKPASRTALFGLMAGKNYDFSGVWKDLQKIVNQEAPAGMTAAKKQSFLDALDTRYKAGGYGLSTGNYRSIAGWASVPIRVQIGPGVGLVTSRQYAFGIFIAHASDATKADTTWAAARAELLREPIREALKTW
jgi:hypothetical protein